MDKHISTLRRKPFPIPTAIWLNAIRIAVEWDETLVHQNDSLGRAAYREDKILLQSHTTAYPRSQQDIEQTFLHEVVHWICQTMGEEELEKNEKFVDMFASLLHQALTMAEYDEP